MYVDILILGAGPTGLGAAWRMEQKKVGCDWLLVDSMDRPGGMACTEVDDKGFRWDLGGHVIHSHFDAFNEAIACHKDWVFPRRGGWVHVQGQWCPTPIQRHLGNLKEGLRIRDELVAIHHERAMASAASSPAPSCSSSSSSSYGDAPQNLGEYYRATFGHALDSLFFSPFNFKQWAWPLHKLDHSWTSLRAGSKSANVPAPSADLHASTQPEDVSAFPYPRLGTGSLWASIAARLPASRQRYNTTVVAIDVENRRARLSSGEVVEYGRCISTLPLNRTIDLMNVDAPSTVIPRSLAPALKHSSTTVTGFGFRGELPKVLEGKSWIFGADAQATFHRASVVSNFSSSMSQNEDCEPRWSIMFETSSSEHRNVDTSPAVLAEAHLEELRRWGAIADDEQPISVWHKHLVLGYPVPFLGRDELLGGEQASLYGGERQATAGLLARLEAHGFVPRGRFSSWRYEESNQDYAFMQGIEAVDLVLVGKRETVHWPSRPDIVSVPRLTLRSREAHNSAHELAAQASKLRPEASAFLIRA